MQEITFPSLQGAVDLNRLIRLCKADIHIGINHHKSCYQTVKDYLAEQHDLSDTDPEVIDKMISGDMVIELQFYPDTPIGSYTIYHYDLDMAVAEALKIMAEEGKV